MSTVTIAFLTYVLPALSDVAPAGSALPQPGDGIALAFEPPPVPLPAVPDPPVPLPAALFEPLEAPLELVSPLDGSLLSPELLH